VPAFSRALKDPFVHARVAGLMAFMASVDVFDVEEVAGKVLPNISGSMIDKEKLVRDQAFKAVELLVKKLESHAATMPETAITENGEPSTLAPLPGQDTLVNSAAGAAGALAGWAISSLGKKLATADMQSTMNAAPGLDQPTSAPPPSGGPSTLPKRPSPLPFMPTASTQNSTLSSPSVPHTSNTAMGLDTASRAKGMQLGASKVPASVAAASLAAQLEEEAAAEEGVEGNPWGTDDLIDINADEDDWSAFESAPIPPTIVEPKPLSAVGYGLNGTTLRDGTSSIPDQSDDPWGGVDSGNIGGMGSNPWNSDDDPWRKDPTPTYPSLSTQPRNLVVTKSRATSVTSSQQSTPVSSPPPPESDGWTEVEKKNPISTPVIPNLASMSKGDKAAEMARRKEERKQRIALLKEQKKAAGGKA
jgi:SCY1-like protein 1